MRARVAGLLPLALVALALGGAASWGLGLVLLALLVLLFALGPRFDVDVERQAVSSAIGAGVGYALASLVYEPDPGRLTEGWARLATAAALAAGARAALVNPRGGYAPTAVLGFLGLAFAGKVTSPGYPLLAAGFLLGLPAAFGGGLPRAPGARRAAAAAAVLALACLIGMSSLAGLSALRAWAHARTRFSTALWQPRTGFSERMDLGALEGLLDSDRRVLRVHGEGLDYLRGTSLDIYELGTWRRSEAGARETPVQLDADPGEGALEIELIGGRRDRLFLPLEARAPKATPGGALRDDLGSLRAASKAAFERVRLSLGARDVAPLAGPRASDLQIPRRLREPLAELAREWTRQLPPGAPPREVLRALERGLSVGFEYSRQVSQSLNVDPVLDFLVRQRRGHCEYFASALALLARASGIPSRVALGYRVSERSPWGHYLVRERNAHAWAEVWVDGAWATHDATPASAQPHNRERVAGYAEASVDALAMGYDEVTTWLAERTLLETSLSWLAGCAVLALIVARGVRGRQRRDRQEDDERPLGFMQPLLAALAERGHTRAADEPLERLASRVPYPDAAEVLGRYAALRYGGQGDRDALARRALDVASALRARERAS